MEENMSYTSQKGKFTMNDTVTDMKRHSLVMRIMYLVSEKDNFQRHEARYSRVQNALETSAGSPLRSLQISSGIKEKFFKRHSGYG